VIFLKEKIKSSYLKIITKFRVNLPLYIYPMKKYLLIFVVLTYLNNARTQTITVTNTNDFGAGSLRQAIHDLNPGSEIRFSPLLLSTGNAYINLDSVLVVSKPLKIIGLYNNSDSLFLNGQGVNGIIESSNNSILELDSLCFINGFKTNGGGAAILKNFGGVLNINDCYFYNNKTIGSSGGAISCTSRLNMNKCHLENNSSTTGGGAIYGSLSVIKHSTFKNNSSISLNAVTGTGSVVYRYGGAVYLRNNSTIENSTFTGNTVQLSSFSNASIFAYGGAIYCFGRCIVRNTTISNNHASAFSNGYNSARGGGIYIQGRLNLFRSTICYNTLSSNDSYVGGARASIFYSISNIIAFNDIRDTGVSSSGKTSGGNNIFSDAYFFSSLPTDQFNVTNAQLVLGPLQNNGMTTKTHMPGIGSIAIDNGSPTDFEMAQNAPITDGVRDVGAAEYHSYCLPFGNLNINSCDGEIYDTPFTFKEVISSGMYWDTLQQSTCDSLLLINLADYTAPILDSLSLPTITGECAVNFPEFPPTATDQCDGLITGTTSTSFPINTVGTHSVSWVFEDGAGNKVFQEQIFEIIDTISPLPNVENLATITSECVINQPIIPIAVDECEWTIFGTTLTTFPIYTEGTHIVVWIYDDGNGNVTEQEQIFILNDVTAPIPEISDLPTVTQECSLNSLPIPEAFDNCDGFISATTQTSLPIYTQGTYIITWTYTDSSGNTTVQNQTVIIDDITPPLISSSPLLTISSECELSSLTSPVYDDACAGTILGTTTTILPITTLGVNTITWVFDDGNGNISTKDQQIVIFDQTAPIPNLASLSSLSEQCVLTSVVAPTATDDCSGIITATTTTVFPINQQGLTTINWIFNDGNGNTTNQLQTVFINDTIPPNSSGADLSVYLDNNGEFNLTPTDIENGSNDNCGISSYQISKSFFTCVDTGDNSVNYIVIDNSGNSDTSTVLVTVLDTISPVPNSSNLLPVYGDFEIINLVQPVATDNCGISSITHDVVLPITNDTVIVWTFTDLNGNVSSQTQNAFIEYSVSISELTEEDIFLFPNPSNDGFTVTVFEKNTLLTIYSFDGKLIDGPISIKGNEQYISIPTIKSGLYVVNISTSKGELLIKLLVE